MAGRTRAREEAEKGERERERMGKKHYVESISQFVCGSKLQESRKLMQRLDMVIMGPPVHHTFLLHSVAAVHCRWDRLTLAYI